MANILEDDKYYEGIDREKGIWVEVDPNEKRDSSFEYIDLVNMFGFGGTATRSTYKLVDRKEYERIQKICDEVYSECMEVAKNEESYEKAMYAARYSDKNFTEGDNNTINDVASRMNDIFVAKLQDLDIDDVRLVAKEMDFRETKAVQASDNYVDSLRELAEMRRTVDRLKYEMQIRAWAVGAKRSDFERTETRNLRGPRGRTIRETTRRFDDGKYRQALTTESEYRQYAMEMERLQSRIKTVESSEIHEKGEKILEAGVYVETNLYLEELIKQNTQITQLVEDFNKGEIYELTPEQLEIPQIALAVINSKRVYTRKMASELPRSVLKNPQVALAVMEKGYAKYTDLPREVQSNRQVVELAIQRDGYQLENVPEQFRGDVELIKLAIKSSNSVNVLEYVTDEIKTDKEVAKQLVEISGASLNYLAPEMKNDRDLAKIAVSHTKRGLRFVSPELRNDEEIVKLAMETNVENIEFISDRLKADANIVGKAVNQDFNLVKHISPDLRENEKLADAFAKYDLMEDYKWDRVSLKDVVNNNYFADEQFRQQVIHYTKNSLDINENLEMHSKTNPNFLEETVSVYPEILNTINLSYRYTNDKLVKMAIKYNYKNVERVWRNTSNNEEFKTEYKTELEMCDTIQKYKADDIKLKDIKGDYFTNPNFYNDVVSAMKDKMQEKFNEITQGLNPNEELNEELQAKFEKQLSKVQTELERRKKFAMLKAGIKDKVDKLLHRDEASKAMKQVSKFEV